MHIATLIQLRAITERRTFWFPQLHIAFQEAGALRQSVCG